MNPNLTPQNRKRLYLVGIAGLVVLSVYGVVNEEQAAAWALLLAPLFGVAINNIEDNNDIL